MRYFIWMNINIPILQQQKGSSEQLAVKSQKASKPLRPISAVPALDQDSLHKIRMIQSEIKRSWQGIDAQRTGIPGNSNIVNNKYKKVKNSESQDRDEEMFHILFKMACKIKELEELKEIRSAHARFNKV